MVLGDLAYTENQQQKECYIDHIPDDQFLVDIGKRTVQFYRETILNTQRVFVNGPMGIFEKEETAFGTRVVWQALAETAAYTVVGGDGVTAINMAWYNSLHHNHGQGGRKAVYVDFIARSV